MKTRWTDGTLLTIGNAKTVKGEPLGYLTGILYLAPYTSGGKKNVCPFSTVGCRASCLFTAGRGRFEKTRVARVAKTVLFHKNPKAFKSDLYAAIRRVIRLAAKRGLLPAIRLNGTSDIEFEKVFQSIFSDFPNVQFYDYTKDFARIVNFIEGRLPANYYLVYSRVENDPIGLKFVSQFSAANVAVVFEKGKIPATYLGREVICGDAHDLRFLDKPNCVVALTAKGQAKKDTTGFVVRNALEEAAFLDNPIRRAYERMA